MSRPVLFSIIESPTHPNFSGLYQRLGFDETRLSSMRAAIKALKKQTPDVVVAEFFYGYGNNYAGINVSNLDVFLRSLQKYSADTRLIVLVEKVERQYVARLETLFPINTILQQPVTAEQMTAALER
jgi:hypothetical protein